VSAAWRSYDGIAEAYARVAHRSCFARPARDLVAALELAPGSRVLDAGAGTGAVAELAADSVGAAGTVIALDPSIEMLRRLAQRGRVRAVAAMLPRLPHAEGRFDAIAAAFVLTHLDDPAAALAAMASALRPRGRLAVSAWAQTESSSPPGTTWQSLAAEFAGGEALSAAVRSALPSQDRFTDPAALAGTLRAAGLARVVARTITYPTEMSTPDFVALRAISTAGRFIASVLASRDWTRFNDEALRRLTSLHGARLRFELRANIAAGVKPPGH
jgi:ubiquinone/menaquinone biosynthesis C-methylase UbiE